MATKGKGHIALFNNQYKDSETKPDFTGSGDISPELIEQLYNAIKTSNKEVKVECAAWKNESKNGKKYLSVQFEIPDPKYANSGGGGSRWPDAQADDFEIPF
jgi:uncharacterized protein (DUF736 family)